MSKDFVEQRDDGYWSAGKRMSLESLVYEFQRGAAPESILRSVALLTLEEIYGTLNEIASGRKSESHAHRTAGKTSSFLAAQEISW